MRIVWFLLTLLYAVLDMCVRVLFLKDRLYL